MKSLRSFVRSTSSGRQKKDSCFSISFSKIGYFCLSYRATLTGRPKNIGSRVASWLLGLKVEYDIDIFLKETKPVQAPTEVGACLKPSLGGWIRACRRRLHNRRHQPDQRHRHGCCGNTGSSHRSCRRSADPAATASSAPCHPGTWTGRNWCWPKSTDQQTSA